MESVKNIQKIDIHVHAAAFPEYAARDDAGNLDPRVVSTERLLQMYDQLGIEKGI